MMKLSILFSAALIFIAGCSQQSGPTEPVPSEQAASTTPSGAEPTTVAGNPGNYEIDVPIPREDIKTELAIIGEPVYRAKDDILVVNVDVANLGNSPLVSAGTRPVQLGVTLAGPDGVDKVPGKRDFIRAKLPLIIEGGRGEVQVKAPVAPLLGLKVQLELVQESVAWFGRGYKQPILDIGTFQRCNGVAGTLCDESGTPLTQQ